MAGVPPPYAPREHAQVVNPTTPSVAVPTPLEYAESTSVCLEWRLSGLKAMYDSTKGDVKSKCVKSAIFGDADNLWEVLWYPNSGAQGGEFASLYLSCVPTAQERDEGIGSKWTRKGIWWFRFEVKSLVPDERTGKIATIATKDASDHTFAVKTANWGWQQFAKRDTLFSHPTVLASDGFVITCTIQAQPQPPAGYWLGLGLPPANPFVTPNTTVNGRPVGSGGGLSEWAGGNGASGGVAGGTAAGGGVKKVVPKDLINSVGALLDDPLYSDIEFVIPAQTYRRNGLSVDTGRKTKPKRIYANKKLLVRCDYFQAMFGSGFREEHGVVDEPHKDDSDDDFDSLSDSDMEDEASDDTPASSNDLTTTSSRGSGAEADQPMPPSPRESTPPGDTDQAGGQSTVGEMEVEEGATAQGATGHADASVEEERVPEPPSKREVPSVVPAAARPSTSGPILGPKKSKVMIRDAAWSTWWAVLYWLYTDVIYFAPLSSSFPPGPSTRSHSRSGSTASFHGAPEPQSRKEWIRQWTDEHGISSTPDNPDPVGPRPVSAKAIYRLADKLDLPALRLRAYQHICSELTSQNIPAEVFSRFSSTFDEVRKVQVAFFLKHWADIKKSETMTQIWQQIRLGKHVGFEDVWPLIVSQLEFRQSV